MELCVKAYLEKRGYTINTEAQTVISACENWYANRVVKDFHERKTVQDEEYELRRLGFAKRCCSDDANLCEVVEINVGKEKSLNDYVNKILDASRFKKMYRQQLERTSATGTTACFIRMDNASFREDGTIKGGKIKLNYTNADCYIPLTVEDGVTTEAAFSGSRLVNNQKETMLIIFTKDEMDVYKSETVLFDKDGKELEERKIEMPLGEVKPFAVLQTAEVNNLDNMAGYGFPKLVSAIPFLEALDLCFNILFGDLDKGDKLILINEMLCKFDANGKEITPNEQAKKTFVLLGEKLPTEKELIHEYNPEIRADSITKTFELILSLLSMMFGYGTKKYSFENGQITTATEYIGERQDQMQELNKQREMAAEYIKDIVKAIIWYSNRFLGTGYDVETEIVVDFDDSYVIDKETELERKRNDSVSFDIPILKIWYLMDAYNITEDEARKYVEGEMQKEQLEDIEDND